MTYNRMEAKPLAGECCFFCGADSLPLVKMPCCEQWACCDTAYISFRGAGRCQFEHESVSPCYFHHNEGHAGKLQECKECHEFFDDV
jgi:hypothetical protein